MSDRLRFTSPLDLREKQTKKDCRAAGWLADWLLFFPGNGDLKKKGGGGEQPGKDLTGKGQVPGRREFCLMCKYAKGRLDACLD